MDKQIKDIPCIILAGGFGTRLRTAVSDVVKPMAPMGHKPFLHVLMDQLHQQGITQFVLALGYMAETVTNYFDQIQLPYSIQYSFEDKPLGTGGALRNALEYVTANEVFAVNGDTFFQLSLSDFYKAASQNNVPLHMAVMPSLDAQRYGNVRLNDNQVTAFQAPEGETTYQNAGMYFIRKESFLPYFEQEICALEQDVFPKLLQNNALYASIFEGFFIDIGIPEDYARAQDIFAKFYIDRSWTLFLDRDGVINQRIVGEYVKAIDEFHFMPGSLASIARFSERFGRIVVVTNQQGIGKGIMTARNLEDIHRYMLSEIEKHGGKIDGVYFAPQLSSENSEMRKPNTGMAHQAKRDFPEIDFSKSVLIGDSDSDIFFGQKLGMITVKLDNVDPSTSRATCKRSDLAACVELFEICTVKNKDANKN